MTQLADYERVRVKGAASQPVAKAGQNFDHLNHQTFHRIPDLLRGIEQVLVIEMGVSRG